ncbi:MAG: LOG family protein [Candidatus Brocadiia bacterium]
MTRPSPPQPPGRRIVAVFGASGVRRGSDGYNEAYRLGRLLAEAGYTVCNGGYGGTMEASARGARDAGGAALGVTNALFDPAAANRYITEERKAPDFFERLRRLLTLGEAYVCLRGSVGTLTEFSLAWTLLQTKALARRPFVCVGEAWAAVLEAYRAHLLVRPKDLRLVTLVDTVEAAAVAVRQGLG